MRHTHSAAPRLALALPLALGVAACDPGSPAESSYDPGETVDDTGGGTGGDDTGVDAGLIGVLVVTHWPEDRTFRAESHAHAVFSRDPEWAEVVDPLGAMAWDGIDVFMSWAGWPLPAEGERNAGFDEDLGWAPRDLSTLDAGERLLVGPLIESYRGEQVGLTYYESDPQDEVTENPFSGGDLDLWIDGGADVGPAELAGAVPSVDPLVLTSHDPLQMLVVGPAEPFTVAWEPSEAADATVVVSLSGDLYSASFGVADAAGELEISAEDIGAQGGDFLFVTVSRIVEGEVALPEGTLLVRSIHEVWTDTVRVEELGFWPPRVLSGDVSTIELYRADGVFTLDGFVLDLGDGIYPGDVEIIDAGHTARVRIDVDEDTWADFRDVLVTTGGETLLAPRQFGVYHPMVGGDTCPEAAFLPEIREGFHFDRRDGRTSESGVLEGCSTGLDYIGADSYHRLSLRDGETVTVSAYWAEGDGMVAIVDACGGQAITCFDDVDQLGTEVLEWTAFEDREVFILFDESLGYDDADLFAVVEVEAAVELYVDGSVVQGEAATVEIDNRSFDFIEGEPVFDFGPGISVEAVRVLGGTGAIAEVDVLAAADAPLGDRTLSVTQGAESGSARPGDFQVDGRLAESDDCGSADALPLLESARYRGTTEGLGDLGIDTVVCGPSTMPAADAVYRFDLPSAGDAISASLTAGFDGAIYVVDACTSRPVACEDVVAGDDTELLTWTAGAGEAGSYYLVVDSRDPTAAGEFVLGVTVP